MEGEAASRPNSIDQVIQAYIAGAYSNLPEAISTALTSSETSLLDLIRALGQHLTSQHDIQRTRAVELLALVVTQLSPTTSIFDRQATRTLTSFFASKLQDGETTATLIAQSLNQSSAPVPSTAPSSKQLGKDGIPKGSEMLAAALRALAALAALDSFGQESAREAAENLIEHVHPRDHPQSVRFLVFVLLDVLIGRHRNALHSLGERFLHGYHDLVEGEKDPRNLMYLFAIDKVLLVEWEMEPELVEKYFDITFCYFPITFRPPPDDPYGITQSDLKAALRGCLTATPAFAPHAMPLLLEKLAASNSNAKRDVLETLELALPVYGRAAAEANGRRLWEGLKIEIFHATDDATSIASQRTLVSLMQVLYSAVDPPEGLAPIIVADCLAELSAPSKVLAAPAASALVCLVRACPSTSYLATTAMLDRLLTIFQDPDEAASRASILAHIATLLEAMRQAYQGEDGLERVSTLAEWHEQQGNPAGSYTAPSTATLLKGTLAAQSDSSATRSHEGDRRPLDARRDLLLSALSNGLQSQSYRSSALLCFVHLTHLPGFLSIAELDYLCQEASALTLLPSPEDAIARTSALDALRDVAQIDAHAIERTTLPMLFGALPDRLTDEGANNGHAGEDEETPFARQRTVVRLVLGALARLCGTSPALLDLLVVRLFTKLDLCCAPPRIGAIDSYAGRSANVGYARGILLTLQTVFDDRQREQRSRDKAVSSPKSLFGAAPKKQDVLMVRYAQDLPTRLCALVLGAAVDDAHSSIEGVAADVSVIQDVGTLLATLVRHLDVTQQRALTDWLYPVFFEGHFSISLRASRALSDALSRTGDPPFLFAPFDDTSQPSRNTVYLLASVLLALQPAVPVPAGGDAVAWLGRVLAWTARAKTKLQVAAGAAALSTCANKQIGPRQGADAQTDVSVRTILESFWDTNVVAPRSDNETEAEATLRQTRALKAWFSVARGFVVRTSPLGEEMVNRAIVQLLEEAVKADSMDVDGAASSPTSLELAKATARTIGTVATPDEMVLTKENGATVRLLYRQRFFSNTLPRLIQGYQSSIASRIGTNKDASAFADPREMLYLMALSSFLPSMPITLLTAQIGELFPLLLRTLELPDGRARGSAAAAIDSVLAGAAARQKREDEESKEAAVRAHAGGEAQVIGKSGATAAAKMPLDVIRHSTHSLVSRLLACCKPGPHAPPLTRIAALRCLATLARSYSFTDATLHAEAREVLRVLGAHRIARAEGTGIDDPKRAVRLEAVDARDAWYAREGASAKA